MSPVDEILTMNLLRVGSGCVSEDLSGLGWL